MSIIRNPLLYASAVLILLGSCSLWDLEFVPFKTFDVTTRSVNIQEISRIRPGFFVLEDDRFIVTTKDTADRMTLQWYTSEGEFQKEISLNRTGNIVQVAKNPFQDGWLLLGTDDTDTYLIDLSSADTTRCIVDLQGLVNSQIGLVETVTGRTFTIDETGHIYLTGSIRQSIGEERMMLLHLSSDFSFQKLRTYSGGGTEGYQIEQVDGDRLLISSKNNSEAFQLWMIDTLGIKIWSRILPDTRSPFFPSFVRMHDSVAYAVGIGRSNRSDAIVLTKVNVDSGNIIGASQYIENSFGSLNHPIISPSSDNKLLVLSSVQNADGQCFYQLQVIETAGIRQEPIQVASGNDILPLYCEQINDFGFLMVGAENVQSSDIIYRILKTDEAGMLE